MMLQSLNLQADKLSGISAAVASAAATAAATAAAAAATLEATSDPGGATTMLTTAPVAHVANGNNSNSNSSSSNSNNSPFSNNNLSSSSSSNNSQQHQQQQQQQQHQQLQYEYLENLTSSPATSGAIAATTTFTGAAKSFHPYLRPNSNNNSSSNIAALSATTAAVAAKMSTTLFETLLHNQINSSPTAPPAVAATAAAASAATPGTAATATAAAAAGATAAAAAAATAAAATSNSSINSRTSLGEQPAVAAPPNRHVAELPRPGEMVPGSYMETCFGGKAANQCVAAAKLGGTTALVARVGQDTSGDEYLNYLRHQSVNVEQVRQVKGNPTGMNEIALSEEGQNYQINVPGANAYLTAKDVALAKKTFREAKVLLCQLETDPRATMCALRQFRGVSILHVSPLRREIPKEIISLPTILVMNQLGAAQLAEMDEVQTLEQARDAAEIILAKGAHSVIITMAEQGAVYMSDRKKPGLCTHVPAADVPRLVDHSGAGDAFVGSLAYHIAHFPKLSREHHICAAHTCAAYSMGGMGTQPSFPGREGAKSDLCFSTPTFNVIPESQRRELASASDSEENIAVPPPTVAAPASKESVAAPPPPDERSAAAPPPEEPVAASPPKKESVAAPPTPEEPVAAAPPKKESVAAPPPPEEPAAPPPPPESSDQPTDKRNTVEEQRTSKATKT